MCMRFGWSSIEPFVFIISSGRYSLFFVTTVGRVTLVRARVLVLVPAFVIAFFMRHLGFVVHGKLYTGAGVRSLVRWDGLWCSAVDSLFPVVETNLGVRAVTERLVAGRAAPAERHTVAHFIRYPVGTDD